MNPQRFRVKHYGEHPNHYKHFDEHFTFTKTHFYEGQTNYQTCENACIKTAIEKLKENQEWYEWLPYGHNNKTNFYIDCWNIQAARINCANLRHEMKSLEIEDI